MKTESIRGKGYVATTLVVESASDLKRIADENPELAIRAINNGLAVIARNEAIKAAKPYSQTTNARAETP